MPTLGSNGDADIEDRLMDTEVGKKGEGGMNGENSMEAYTLLYVKQRANGNLLCDSRNPNQGPLTTQSGGKGWEVGRRFKREGMYVHLCLIHVDVWQKSMQHCKAIIL